MDNTEKKTVGKTKLEKDEYKKYAEEMIALTVCALNGEKPDTEHLKSLELDKLFSVCEEHILTACVAYALESAGIKDHNFTQAREKAIRKNILLDAERKKILNRLEKEHIWHMPLKGSILKDWYPKLGMRQMSDNDILCDGEYRSRIRDIMVDLGFKVEHYERGCDDAYFKEPVCNFEMHNELFNAHHIGKLHSYYENVKTRLIKDEGSEYGYHFSDEDFYIYLTAHEYKHFSGGGTGVRSLVDTYVIVKKFGDKFDWDHINRELVELEIAGYEKNSRELALKVFSGAALSAKEKDMLDYYIFSGTYGNLDNSVENGIKRYGGTKAGYVLYRLFPPYEFLITSVPWVKKSKLLIPAAWAYRFIRGPFTNSRHIRQEIKALNREK